MKHPRFGSEKLPQGRANAPARRLPVAGFALLPVADCFARLVCKGGPGTARGDNPHLPPKQGTTCPQSIVKSHASACAPAERRELLRGRSSPESCACEVKAKAPKLFQRRFLRLDFGGHALDLSVSLSKANVRDGDSIDACVQPVSLFASEAAFALHLPGGPALSLGDPFKGGKKAQRAVGAGPADPSNPGCVCCPWTTALW